MARYFLRFRHSDTGLTPTFTLFKKASDLSDQAPPSIIEIAFGSYYFDYIPTFDVIFEVDGGASIPTEEVRYIFDTIGPKDTFVDEPTSQVKDDVWDDTVNRTGGTKGDFVENISTAAVISDAVWDELLSGHQAGGSTGLFINNIFRLLKNKAFINATTKQLEVYDDAGTTIIFTFDLKDENGVASATRIFRRLPL